MIFQLKQDLIIPKGGDTGYDFYPKSEFVLTYSQEAHDASAEKLVVAMHLLRAKDATFVRKLAALTLSKEGRKGKMLNEKEVNEYLAQAAQHEADVKAHNETIAGLLLEEQDTSEKKMPALHKKMSKAQAALEAAVAAQGELQPVVEEYATIDTYEEVVDYFTNRGKLTDEGVEWAKKLSFQGIALGDLVVV